MSNVTFQNATVNLNGTLIEVGAKAPNFVMCKGDLSDYELSENTGKVIVLSVVPSLDTPVCQASARAFNKKLSGMGAQVLCISKDLPFAQSRFCQAEGIENVIPLSDFRDDSNFGTNYGLAIADTALRGLLTRAVIVIDKTGSVSYVQLVNEITNEPDYDAVVKAVASVI